MYPRYPVQLTTLEEDFRAIGLLPQEDTKEISETDNSNEPRDIPSPDPSTAAGNDDSQPTPARHKYAKQLKPKMAPEDGNGGYDPEGDGGSQKKGGGGSYTPPRGGKESRVESDEGHVNAGYTLLKNKIMKKVKDTGKAPAVAQGLAPVKSIAGMKKEASNLTRASELVSEVEALLSGSQMDEEFNGLVHGFSLIGENCSLLANRLVDIAEHYNVDKAISAMESLYNNAIEARGILEDAAKAEDEDLDLESVKDAFRMMTLTLMDAVEAYDATISEMKKEDDDSDDDDDDSDDDDSDDDDDDDDDSDDDEKGGIAARMAKLKAGKKGPFGK